MDDMELLVGDYVLLLRGNVIELLHSSGSHEALHVRFAAVEAKPRRDGDLDVKVGVESWGEVLPKAKVRVPAAQQPEVMAFFGEATRRRDAMA